MRLTDNRRARTSFLVLVLVTLLAGDAWRYTIGWTGFSILVGLLGGAAIALLVAERGRWHVRSLPYPLLVFLALATASLAWSFYPGATALGLAATWLTVVAAGAVAVVYSWAEILRGLELALRVILGLSLAFELVVAVVVRHPVLPLIPQPGVDYAALDPIPKMLYWSRNELLDVLHGGKIQGIVGNSALLSFIALLGIIVFALRLAGGRTHRTGGVLWLVVAVLCLVFSRSATNLVGLVAVIIVASAIVIVRRARTPRARAVSQLSIVGVVAAGAASALVFRSGVLALLGKSEDLTNRTEIWDAVIALAQQRPAFGWGWVSYWVPWVAPFDTLAFNNGVRQLHAHNAWLDIWLQLGIAGLLVFGALVISALVRAWSIAVDRPQAARGPGGYTAGSMLPFLLLVALLVQSVAESRLLVEYGLFLLSLIAIKSKRDPSFDDAP